MYQKYVDEVSSKQKKQPTVSEVEIVKNIPKPKNLTIIEPSPAKVEFRVKKMKEPEVRLSPASEYD